MGDKEYITVNRPLAEPIYNKGRSADGNF